MCSLLLPRGLSTDNARIKQTVLNKRSFVLLSTLATHRSPHPPGALCPSSDRRAAYASNRTPRPQARTRTPSRARAQSAAQYARRERRGRARGHDRCGRAWARARDSRRTRCSPRAGASSRRTARRRCLCAPARPSAPSRPRGARASWSRALAGWAWRRSPFKHARSHAERGRDARYSRRTASTCEAPRSPLRRGQARRLGNVAPRWHACRPTACVARAVLKMIRRRHGGREGDAHDRDGGGDEGRDGVSGNSSGAGEEGSVSERGKGRYSGA
jgi:hypothetical protein